MKEADILIKNGTILTMDPQRTFIEKGFLCIRGDTISAVSKGDPQEIGAGKTIDAKGGLQLGPAGPRDRAGEKPGNLALVGALGGILQAGIERGVDVEAL